MSSRTTSKDRLPPVGYWRPLLAAEQWKPVLNLG